MFQCDWITRLSWYAYCELIAIPSSHLISYSELSILLQLKIQFYILDEQLIDWFSLSKMVTNGQYMVKRVSEAYKKLIYNFYLDACWLTCACFLFAFSIFILLFNLMTRTESDWRERNIQTTNPNCAVSVCADFNQKKVSYFQIFITFR